MVEHSTHKPQIYNSNLPHVPRDRKKSFSNNDCFRLPDFSYDGRIKIVPEYRNEATSFNNIVWTKETVDKLINQFREGNLAAG